MSPPHETIAIENVVASSDLGQELDLDAVSQDLTGTDYNPEHFPRLVYRTHEPKAASLIFRSGKVVCTGAKNVPDITAALERVFEELSGLGIDVAEVPTIEIQNIVLSADLGNRLNLNAIAIGLGLERIEYEPEQFPGLVYRLDDPDVVVLLFGSGKLVITDGSDTDEADTALTVVSDRLDDLDLLE